MKAISLWEPWATLVVLGEKRFETRSWDTSYRGPLLIHATKRWTPEQARICGHEPFRTVLCRALGIPGYAVPSWRRCFAFGCLLGVVKLKRTCDVQVVLDMQADGDVADQEIAFGDYSPGRRAWHLRACRRFAQPIPCRARRRLFEVPESLIARAQ